jgi:hypothetical protein
MRPLSTNARGQREKSSALWAMVRGSETESEPRSKYAPPARPPSPLARPPVVPPHCHPLPRRRSREKCQMLRNLPVRAAVRTGSCHDVRQITCVRAGERSNRAVDKLLSCGCFATTRLALRARAFIRHYIVDDRGLRLRLYGGPACLPIPLQVGLEGHLEPWAERASPSVGRRLLPVWSACTCSTRACESW